MGRIEKEEQPANANGAKEPWEQLGRPCTEAYFGSHPGFMNPADLYLLLGFFHPFTCVSVFDRSNSVSRLNEKLD
jgi:hypothetical protein